MKIAHRETKALALTSIALSYHEAGEFDRAVELLDLAVELVIPEP
ncbi:MAG: hypothetical protein SWY16_07845 [Cyanobacteriota bacterium]|nr:hypothetical protein [Cyanobacteriota bacterium]